MRTRASPDRTRAERPACARWACLLVAVAAGAASAGAQAAGQREAVVAACSDLAQGARIVETDAGPILVATATAPVPAAARADRALAESAAVAVIEARAEAALFLAGEYERTVASGASRSASSSQGATAREQWLRTLSRSMARTKLASGERIALRRSEGAVRALVAWGLSESTSESVDPGTLGAIADAALADPDAPACEMRWVRDAAGRDRLLVLVSIYPEPHAGPCTAGDEGKPPCGCRLCRTTVLKAKLAKTVAEWGKEGGVSVVRTLRRESRQAIDNAERGAAAARAVATRSRTSATATDVDTALPADFFARSAFEYRHGDRRSVGAALVPIDATRQGMQEHGSGDAR